MPPPLDLIGLRFGRLTVIERIAAPEGTKKIAHWRCRCLCGGETTTRGHLLKRGTTQSCGCLQRERTSEAAKVSSRKHGLADKHPLWRTWMSMRSRCNNPNATGYARYGGRGITLCARWDDFESFIADVGERPSPSHSLDRCDVDGHYEPGNVRWATRFEQANNRRDNTRVEYKGQTLTMRQAWRAAGCVVSRRTLLRRLDRGWALEAALETPRLR